MTEKKYPEPAVDPNLVMAAGKPLGRDMNAFERAIAAKFKADPRTDKAAKESLDALYPSTPDGVTGNVTTVYDPEVDAATRQVLADFDELGNSEAALYAASRPLPTPVVDSAHALAAELAAEAFPDDEDTDELTPVDRLDLQFSRTGPETGKKPAPNEAFPPPTVEDTDTEAWPEQLPKAIIEAPDLIKVLDFYNLSEDQVLHMILAQEKPLSTEGKKTLWDKEIEMACLTEEDINACIHEFLAKGRVERDYSFYNGAITFTLESRNPEHDRIRDSKLAAVLREHDGYITPDLEEKHLFHWKTAGSLRSFVGFGKEWKDGEGIEETAAFIDKLPSVGFQLLSQAVAKLDNLCYFAAQKMSIENF